MATRVIVLGEQEEKKQLVKIDFQQFLSKDKEVETAWGKPKEFDNIELVSKGSKDDREYDIMFAYNDGKRSEGILYLGQFNDGLVE